MNSDYYDGHFSTIANLGDLPSGSFITLKNHSLNFRMPNSDIAVTGHSISAKYTIYENNVSKKTITLNNTSSANITTYTTTAATNITVGLQVTATFLKTNWNDGIPSPNGMTRPSVVADLYFQSQIPTTAFMLIGYDGLAVNFGNNKTAYFGAESATIKYGNQGLRINGDGIKKLNPNGGGQWTNLGTQKVTVLPNSDYTLADDDEFLIAKSNYTADHRLYLPSSTYAGRQIFVKDLSDKTI